MRHNETFLDYNNLIPNSMKMKIPNKYKPKVFSFLQKLFVAPNSRNVTIYRFSNFKYYLGIQGWNSVKPFALSTKSQNVMFCKGRMKGKGGESSGNRGVLLKQISSQLLLS